MTAAFLQLRAELRRHWVGWILLIALTGVGLGAGLAGMEGAARADNAVERLHRATRLADVFIDRSAPLAPGTAALRRRTAALPQVAAWTTTRGYLPSGLGVLGNGIADAITIYGDTDDRVGRDLNLNHLVAGRQLDPTKPDEVIADTAAANVLGLRVGDTVTLTFPHIRVLVHVVGIRARIWSTGSPGYLELATAFYQQYDRGRLPIWGEEDGYQLRHGQADVPAFRTAVQRLSGKAFASFYVSRDDERVRQHELSIVARGLRLVALFLIAATIVLASLGVARASAQEAAAVRTLTALGVTPRGLVLLGALRGALLGVGAGVVALLVALALSPLSPLGEAHGVDPNPGFYADPLLLLGVPMTALFLAVAAAIATRRVGGAHGRGRRTHAPSRVGHSLPLPLQLGVTSLVRGDGIAGRRSALAGSVAAVAALMAAIVFAASLAHLTRHPELFGVRWDAAVMTGDGKMATRLKANAAVADAARAGPDVQLQIDGLPVGISSATPIKGDIGLTLTAGRAPQTPDEIVLAPRTAASIGRRVGDVVTVASATTRVRMRVVGIAVLAETAESGLGSGAHVTLAGLQRLEPDAGAGTYVVRFSPGVDREAAIRRLGLAPPATPGSVSRLAGLHAVPATLAAIVAVVALGGLLVALLASVRCQRRDLAVLKTLGLVPRQMLAVIVSQALVMAAVAIAIGIPLGLATGRWAWIAAADSLGVAIDVVDPGAQIAVAALAVLVSAAAAAVLPGVRAAATRPAEILLRDADG